MNKHIDLIVSRPVQAGDNLRKHGLHRLLNLGLLPSLQVLRARLALFSKARERLGIGGHSRRCSGGLHAERLDDDAQMATALRAAAAGVGDDTRGLALPLVKQGVERRLERRGQAAVVLRCEEDVGVKLAHDGGPLARVLVGVLGRWVRLRAAGRVDGLVKDGQRVLLEVERREAGVGAGGERLQDAARVAGNVAAQPRGARAADDEGNLLGRGHVGAVSQWWLGGCEGFN